MKGCLRPCAVFLAALMWLSPSLAPAKPQKMRDVCDTIAANVILSKFAQMVQAADLGTFLSSRGPFTVFVPTDSAFSRLPPAEFDALLRPENKERLQMIVLFHVVNGKRLTSKDLLALKTTLSCQGAPLTFRTSKSGTQFVMKSKIVSSDLLCSNGTISQIDTVLMPPESALPPIAAGPVTPPHAPASDTNAPAPNVPGSLTNAAPE